MCTEVRVGQEGYIFICHNRKRKDTSGSLKKKRLDKRKILQQEGMETTEDKQIDIGEF